MFDITIDYKSPFEKLEKVIELLSWYNRPLTQYDRPPRAFLLGSEFESLPIHNKTLSGILLNNCKGIVSDKALLCISKKHYIFNQAKKAMAKQNC